MNDPPYRRTTCRRRLGVALVVVLVSLGVISAMLMSMARMTLLSQRQINSHQRQEQAQWLMEAGVQHAALALGRQPNYRGETWRLVVTDESPSGAAGNRLAAGESAPFRPASVAELTVAVGETESTMCLLQVTVRYPLDARYPVKLTRQIWIPFPPRPGVES